MSDSIDIRTIKWVGGLLLGAITTSGAAVHFFHEQYITPIKEFESSRKIEKLEDQLKSQKASIEKIDNLQTRLDKAQEKLALIENQNLFIKGEIYPATINTIKIGDSADTVRKEFEENELRESFNDPDRPSINVALKNSVFESVNYSYDKSTKSITNIIFTLDYRKELGNDFLLKSLTKALGTPEKAAVKGQFRWSRPQLPQAYLMYDRYYTILREGYAPAVWREPEE